MSKKSKKWLSQFLRVQDYIFIFLALSNQRPKCIYCTVFLKMYNNMKQREAADLHNWEAGSSKMSSLFSFLLT